MAWPLATFPRAGGIRVEKDYQLQHICDGPPIVPRRNQYSDKIRGVALAEGLLLEGDARSNAGVSFSLASCDRWFETLLVGFSSRHDQGDWMEFCVRIDQDRYYGRSLKINDRLPTCKAGHVVVQVQGSAEGVWCNGGPLCRRSSIPINSRERSYRCRTCDFKICSGCYERKSQEVIVAYEHACEGDENVSIRVDGLGARVEYLVNDDVVHRSEMIPQFPLICKVVNIIRRTPKTEEWKMRLPVKELRWVGRVVAVLSIIHVGEDGAVTTSCSNMAGEDIARVENTVGETIADLRQSLKRQTDLINASQLCFVTEDGGRLADHEEWPPARPMEGKIAVYGNGLGALLGGDAGQTCLMAR